MSLELADALRGLVEYTRQARGWAAEPKIGSSITGQLQGAVVRTEPSVVPSRSAPVSGGRPEQCVGVRRRSPDVIRPGASQYDRWQVAST